LFGVSLWVEVVARKDANERRYALVHLEGRWETMPADRIQLPDAFLKS
jgi:hypothetical protein